MNIQPDVLSRYSDAAKQKSADLCCPIDYDKDLLSPLPREIIEKDYGCGDPSRYVKPGDTVLDLGSGGGKICYMAAQIAGERGKIIGVDMNDDMLALAKKYQAEMAEKIGYNTVEFRKGYIQDLALDLESVQCYLSENPVTNLQGQQQFQAWEARQRLKQPLIASDSIDLVISNCVLNLVGDGEKKQLIDEIFRVVKPGGRIAISDIVSAKNIPASMKQDESLWSGCISGAFHEKAFLDSVVESGFVGARYDQWSAEPWQTIEDIEFRSVTLTAHKPGVYNRENINPIVIYRGPYARIHDDHGNLYIRGERTEIDQAVYRSLVEYPDYKNDFIFTSSPEQNTSPAESSCCSPKQCNSPS